LIAIFDKPHDTFKHMEHQAGKKYLCCIFRIEREKELIEGED